jgi:N-acetylglucosamine-6-sulfatase
MTGEKQFLRPLPLGRIGLIVVGLLTVALLVGSNAAEAEAAKKKPPRPNVVFIMSDDQRTDEMKWMPKTRRLLGEAGTTFSRFFAPFPLCCPARMSVMTGQYPHNHGVDGNFPPEGYYGLSRRAQLNTLPVWLKRAGYRTSHIGKYLNGYGVVNQTEIPPGWTDWHGTIDQTSYDMFNYWVNDNGTVTKYGDDAWNEAIMSFSREVANQTFADYNGLLGFILQNLIVPFQGENSVFGDTDPDTHQVDQLADRAVRFVRRSAPKRAPFFLQFAPPAPHREDLPENAGYRGINPRVPARYERKVQNLRFTDSPSFDEADISDKPGLLGELDPLADQRNTAPLSGLEQIENYRRGRIGNLWALDDAVARLVRTVKKAGELRNTIFIFHSDNGWLLGEHRIPGDKFVPYEESLLVPTIIRGPGFPANRKVKAMGANVDLTRTILNAAKAKPNRVQDGIDLRPLARGKGPKRSATLIEATRALFVLPGFPYQWDVPYHGVRTDRFKYVNWSTGGEELYDLVNDPYEMENLASDPAFVETKAELLALADRLRDCKGKACVAR